MCDSLDEFAFFNFYYHRHCYHMLCGPLQSENKKKKNYYEVKT